MSKRLFAFRNRWSLALVLMVSAVGSIALVGALSAQTAPAVFEPSNVDVQWYAESQDIPLQEAAHRLEVRHASDPFVQRILAAYPGRYAGMWVEHEPEFRLVIRFTGSDDGLDVAFVEAARAPMTISIQPGAAHSLDHLLEAQTAIATNLGDQYAGGGVDVKANQVYVNVVGDDQDDADALAGTLSAAYDVPVVVRLLAEPDSLMSTYGGKRLSHYTTYSTLECTSGFTVANYEGATGLVTAGHCSNNMPLYWETSTHGYSMQFVDEQFDSTHDVQWHSVYGTEYDDYYNGSSLVDVRLN